MKITNVQLPNLRNISSFKTSKTEYVNKDCESEGIILSFSIEEILSFLRQRASPSNHIPRT